MISRKVWYLARWLTQVTLLLITMKFDIRTIEWRERSITLKLSTTPRNNQLQALRQQLQQIKYQKKEENEISTSTKVSNNHYNDSENGRVYSDDLQPLHVKLKQKWIDRKKLIANALIFISRISHQLQKYNFLPKDSRIPDVVTDGYILDILSRWGMSLDLIIIKSIMTPVTKSKKMYDPEDIGIEDTIYVNNKDTIL